MPKFFVASNDAISPDNYCDTSLSNLKEKIRSKSNTSWTIRIYDFTFSLPNMCRFIEGDILVIEKFTLKVGEGNTCRRIDLPVEQLAAKPEPTAVEPVTEPVAEPEPPAAEPLGPDSFGGEDAPHAVSAETLRQELAEMHKPVAVPTPSATATKFPVIQRRVKS